MERQILDVSQVNEYIKNLLDGDELLAGLCIRGELSNYKIYPSGHHYFTLKDAGGALRCVMFRSSAARLRFRPENGMKVLAMGRITVFPRDGAYQLYCSDVTPDGVGDLYVAFEQLKRKLSSEGLFDAQYKKPLPPFPHRIAIITSGAGAAIMDMLRILGKRYPLSKVVILPVRVQGAEAPAEIAGAIRYANKYQVADVIITGRGGGSMEDLWAFNDERVARMIAASEIPVVSAVGHEPDVTIIDYVADLRAATPSNGAELAVPDQLELKQYVDQLGQRCRQAMLGQLQNASQKLERLRTSNVLTDPMVPVHNGRTRLDTAQQKLTDLLDRRQHLERTRLAGLTSTLDALSPLKVLGRGYAMAQDENGKVITSVHSVELGERIRLRVADGQLGCTVMKQYPLETSEKEQKTNGSKEETL